MERQCRMDAAALMVLLAVVAGGMEEGGVVEGCSGVDSLSTRQPATLRRGGSAVRGGARGRGGGPGSTGGDSPPGHLWC